MTVMAKAIVPLGTDRATLNNTNAPKNIVRYKCDGTGCVTDVGLIGRWNTKMDAGIQEVVDHHNTQSTLYGNQVGGGEKSEYHRQAAGRINTAYESTRCSYAMKDMSVAGITAQIRTDCQTLNQSNGGRLVNFEQKSASECRKWYNVQNYPHDVFLPSRISVAYSLLPRVIEREQQQRKADEEREQFELAAELAASEDPHDPRFNFVWKSNEQRARYRREQDEINDKVAVANFAAVRARQDRQLKENLREMEDDETRRRGGYVPEKDSLYCRK
jgi:hypothetical protein